LFTVVVAVGVDWFDRVVSRGVTHALVDFGVFPVGSPVQSQQLTIRNTGNATAALRLTPAVSAPFRMSGSSIIGSNGSGTLRVEYTPTSSPSTQQVTIEAVGACTAPLAVTLQGGTGPFAVVQTATVTETCPPPAAMSTALQIANMGDKPLRIHCREHGTSGLALQFPLPDDPFGTGELAVPPGGVATMPVTLLPGPILAGSVTAFVDCFDNEPIANLRTTTVTRTLVEEGEPCIAPGAP
jgi:hypothetical protein